MHLLQWNDFISNGHSREELGTIKYLSRRPVVITMALHGHVLGNDLQDGQGSAAQQAVGYSCVLFAWIVRRRSA